MTSLRHTIGLLIFLATFSGSAAQIGSSDPFILRQDSKPRQITFENPSGAPGNGGRQDKGAKGRPAETVKPGQACTLMDFRGTGIVRHIWLTVQDRKPAELRRLRIDIFWDGSDKPAVSAPLGDFFGTGLAQRTPFECAYFSDPEGRSFNCSIPMPFRARARVVLTNESAENITLFYSISLSEEKVPVDAGYFHAYWHRMPNQKPGTDYEILPRVTGKGRFIGSNVGILTHPLYNGSWFGEGEVKMYLDGDTNFPTLNGTGAEDYIGTAWGLGAFSQSSSGCTVADPEHCRWAFYKFHIEDPIYFTKVCKVTIQELGGATLAILRSIKAAGAEVLPVSVAGDHALNLLDMKSPPKLEDPDFPDGWVNFYRSDDYSSTAYFYLDRPSDNLPPLPPASDRASGL